MKSIEIGISEISDIDTVRKPTKNTGDPATDGFHLGSLLLFRRGGGTDFCLTARTAQVGPVDVGPEFFACNRASSGAFDDRAALGGHLTYATEPLIDHGRRHINGPGQPGLATQAFTGFSDELSRHGDNYSAALVFAQATLQYAANSIAIYG